MAVFKITADDGQTYNVTAPDEETATTEFAKQYKPLGNAQRAVEMVKHPGRSLEDILRTASNFITFGGRDRLAPYLGTGRTHEQEKQETSLADARLGTFDEAANLGLLALQPSAAARYAPQTVSGQIGKTAGFAGEGAAQSGIQSVVEGRDDVGSSMAEGAALGTLAQLKPLAQSFTAPLGSVLKTGGNVLRGGDNPALQDLATMVSPRLPATARTVMRVGGGMQRVAPPSGGRDTFARMLAGMERLY